MLQFDEYKVKLNNLLPQLDELEKALNLESAAREVDFLEAQSASDGFWDNPENSQRVLQKLKQLKNKLESQEKRRASWEDMMVLCEMGNEEEDESLLPELEEEYNALIQSVDPAHRGVRRLQRYFGLPCRCRRNGSPGLGPNALPHVHPLGRTSWLLL